VVAGGVVVVIVGYQIAKPPLFRKNAIRSRRRLMSQGPSGIGNTSPYQRDDVIGERQIAVVDALP